MKKRKGAASFYIVAFSTLILVVIATSFAMVIMSEMTRTMNDDLAQSAYDSALAGVEDAKVAFANYQRCAEANFSGTECQRIKGIMDNPDCEMVKKMLYTDKKYNEPIDGEQTLGGIETVAGGKTTTTNQAYTCAKIITNLTDYRSSLGTKTGKYVQTIRAGVADGESNNVSKIRFSWYSIKKDNPVAWNSVDNNGKGIFKTTSEISNPPTIEMQIVQTAESFNLSQFDEAKINGDSSQTNRATLYLTPRPANGTTTISREKVAKTNDHSIMKEPFEVNCNENGEFYCSVDIELPMAIGGNTDAARANDTFLISVSIPYRDPDTDFELTLMCDNGVNCGGKRASEINGGSDDVIAIKNTQVAIEATGRANDLVRRVETRLETSDTSFGMGTQSPYYALEILGGGTVTKDMTVTYENHSGPFYF